MIEGPATSEETKVARMVITAVIVIVAMMTGCTYRQTVILPQRMAEKNFCWSLVPGTGLGGWSGATPQFAYLPCRTGPAEAK